MKKMIRPFSILCLLIYLSFVHSLAQISPKRGMAYGYHSVADINTVSSGASWWYNWSSNPDAAIASYYQSVGIEFVPMLWNGSFDVNTIIANIKPDAKYLLAFNEPNFNVESNMTPQQAVNLWPQLEQIAAAKNLKIVSASAAYCGGSVCVSGYTSPITWHDEFFALCPTCQVDFIAFHTYEPTVGGAKSLTDNLKKYGRPIWVTEFANWDAAQAPADKILYQQQLVQLYENDPDIYRYAWFTGRSSSNPAVNLLAGDGALTALGTAYLNASYPVTTIPGKVEAESHYRRRGTDLETTTDIGGGQNVGWTDPGTWNEYLLNVTTSGSHTFNFRVASNVNTGSFDIYVDDQLVKSNVTVSSTGGWQTWTDMPVTGIVMTTGQHLVRFEYTGSGTNLNFFNVSYEGNVVANADFSASPTTSCVGNTIVFTDQTTNKTGGETYAWNFGIGASPATATGAGPHTVTYSTAGMKSPSLIVTNNVGPDTKTKTDYITISNPPTGCLFSDDFENNSVDWITPIPGAFSHAESGSVWTVSNGGYGEWEYINYSFNNGTTMSPLNFSCAANKPIVHIKAKTSSNALLKISLVDGNGRVVDNLPAANLEITNSYTTYSVDFTGAFQNYYGGDPGILDSTNITAIQFALNPGYFSFPYTGTNGTYNSSFSGSLDIDWIGIGANCNAPTLPVTLVQFRGEAFNNYCRLSWSTASEINNDYFIVEKSADGIMFEKAGIVSGRGNSSSFTDYYYNDYSCNGKTTYYRLKQVDTDGKFSYSEVINVSGEENDESILNIYPNPSESTHFIIEWKGMARESIEISTILGERVYLKEMNTDDRISAMELPFKLEKGVYLVKSLNLGHIRKLIIN